MAAAEQWLMTPAMGLDQRRPVDLMQTIDGIAQVTQLLLRMRYGVYA
ncbi:MAG: MbcA/ParS/Xre antitoxin family protein [Polaromonas sp.]|nr:MbcA/ParS/Xre antitoxin family protein [Polaromonas sp.]MDI1240027.1 MbcA/ParS/Xre antitoxin family protein [Polaromonas sp.]